MLLCLLVALAVLFSALPAALFLGNLPRYRAPGPETGDAARISVLIPARDEEADIAACLERVLASAGVELEVLVLDDASTDRTAAIVQEIAARDARVTLLRAPGLPEGWNGKQHACWLLAQCAAEDLMLFLDAGVRLAPDAIARCAAARKRSGVALLSGFPRQIAASWMGRLLLPLSRFVLLGFLPLSRMRKSTRPACAAGCGQFLLVQRAPYFVSGGHLAIRATRHDGLRLPQMLRRHDFRTDIIDLTELAEARTYGSNRAAWQGLAKNATEGLAAPARIVPWTIVLLLGQVAPLLLAVAWCALMLPAIAGSAGATAWTRESVLLTLGIWLALLASYLPRLLAVRRLRQPLLSALLHPLGVALLLALEWYALARQALGRPVVWRARAYSSRTGGEIAWPQARRANHGA